MKNFITASFSSVNHFVELGNKAVDLIAQLDQATREAMRDDTQIGSAV
jgi:hypothetical protein